MKRFSKSSLFCTLFLAIAAIAAISFVSVGTYAASDPIEDGLVLKNLWKEYRRTREKDLPVKSEKILEDIKREANSKHLVYDYYKAVNEYVDVASSVNWKLRDSLVSKRDEELKAFGEPLLLYVSGIVGGDNLSVLDFLEKNRTALGVSSLSGFWQSYPASYKRRALAAYYSNDYEYVLASQMYRNHYASGSFSYDSAQGEATEALKQLFLKGVGSRYPFNALWELVQINSFHNDNAAPAQDKNNDKNNDSDRDKYRDKEAALKDFIAKYKGKSVVVMAENEILQLHRNRIERDGMATSEQYRNLRSEAAKVVEFHRTFKGKDAELIADENYAQYLVDRLDATSISMDMQQDSILVILRNLPDAHIRVCGDPDGKLELFSADVSNPVRSYYRLDTLCVAAPVLSDGRYYFFAASGKSKCEAYHYRYSLAAQLTSTPDGIYIFLADRNSGKPVEVADMEVISSEKTIAEASSVKLSGQTLLPREIADSLMSKAGGVRYLRCTAVEEGVTKKTELLSLYGYSYSDVEPVAAGLDAADSAAGSSGGTSGEAAERTELADEFYASGNLTARCELFLDKSAFYPGETVHFKAVSYYDNGNGKMRTATEGKNVRVVFSDAAGKEVKTARLRTNDYGSVAGSFEIPASSYLNGNWRITASIDGCVGAVAWLVVDEYELPSFNVTFAGDDRLYLSGDTVPVSGKVISYAGNSLSDADIRYELWKMSDLVGKGKLELDNSGSFTVPVKTSQEDSWACYRLTVKLTDGAGQTKEFSTRRIVSDRFYIDITADESQFSTGSVVAGSDRFNSPNAVGKTAVKSSVRRYPYWARNIRILSGNTLSFSVEARDADGRKVVLPSAAEYRIERRLSGSHSSEAAVDEDDVVKVAEGIAKNGKSVEISLKDCHSGLYRVVAVCKYSGRDSSDWFRKECSCTAEAEMLFLLLRDDDKELNAPVESVIKVNEKEYGLQLQLGAGAGDVWTVVSLYDSQTRLQHTSLVHLGDLTSLLIPYPQGCSGNLLLTAVYFREGRFHSFEHECHRQTSDFVKPLSVSSLSDSYSPGTEYVIKLSSEPETEILASIFDRSTEDIAPNVWSAVTPFSHSICLNTTNDAGEFIFRTSGLWIEGRRFYTKSASMSPSMADSSLRAESNSSMAGAMDSAFMETSSDDAEVVGLGKSRNAAEEEFIDAFDSGRMNLEAFRKDFKTVLAFEPFVKTDASGNAEIHFRTSDKLSTYILSLFVHDRDMHNTVSRSEFVVNSPVALTMHAPSFLYSGDRCDMSVSVSNNGSVDITGILTASVPFIVQSAPVTVPAGSSKTVKFSVTVPAATQNYKMDFKVVFRAKSSDGVEYSDAMLSEVRLLPAKQVLTESHSAVYRLGMDRDSLVRAIENEFVNTSHFGAVRMERTVADIAADILSSQVEPASNNVLDLVKALYSNLMISGVDKSDKNAAFHNRYAEELLKKILLCRTASGGFGWYAGMQASPIVTAVVVEEFALLVRSGRIVLSESSSAVDIKAGIVSGNGVSANDTSHSEISLIDSNVSGDGNSVYNMSHGENYMVDSEIPGNGESANVSTIVLPKEVLTEAVKYIDRCYFSGSDDFLWRGDVSTEQYVYLRSLFPEIPLSAEQIKSESGAKAFTERISQLKNYLCPKTSADKLNGRLLNKSRRAAAALNFTKAAASKGNSANSSRNSQSTQSGKSAKSGNNGFVLSLGNGITLRRINKTLARDIASIKEYAVAHSSGGVYFPNAVLPFRGLLETEAYAHSLICNLLSDWNDMLTSSDCLSFGRAFRNGDAEAARIADGVRLWLLLQKDSQKWETDPAFVSAVNSILSGSESLMSTSVVVLSKIYEKPFPGIKASGNGLKIDKEYIVKKSLDLSVGDKVIVRYIVRNDESRSFVRLTIPYNACFRPVSQLSGNCGWWSLAPYFERNEALNAANGKQASSGIVYPVGMAAQQRSSGIACPIGMVIPQGYREVRSDRIVYDFDVFPEETTIIEEEFYVSQSGVFTVPVAEVESLYAPHYRANSGYSVPVVSR